tara:strand:+ start:116 stop:292 length:177 start_codon:yes stop_codon:yes gene_type:complete
MNYWNKTPLFRLLIPLIIGIVFSIYFAFNEEIKKECLKWDIPFYDVSTEGAYLFEINA